MELPQPDSSPRKRRRKRRTRPMPTWLTDKPDLDEVARNRVLMFLSIISGEKTVTTAIEETGISRNLYYQLETKALNAMLLALAPGAEGDPSTDAAGFRNRISELEAKLQQAEHAQRRAERLLHLHRKMTPTGPLKSRRGRPPKTPTSSTRTGKKGWRSSTTAIAEKKPRKPRTPRSSTRATAPSTPPPAGVSGVPSAGSENSPAPTR
jgi:hypothetical protein